MFSGCVAFDTTHTCPVDARANSATSPDISKIPNTETYKRYTNSHNIHTGFQSVIYRSRRGMICTSP